MDADKSGIKPRWNDDVSGVVHAAGMYMYGIESRLAMDSLIPELHTVIDSECVDWETETGKPFFKFIGRDIRMIVE